MNTERDDAEARACVDAIHSGDLGLLNQLLRANPDLANKRIDGQRTFLHVATDWPGNSPHSAATVSALIAHGADINAKFVGRHSETPLHWAASSDDVGAIDVLLDHGADLEAPGGVIGGGTPLADAVAFGQWRAARRLLQRGARTTLWQAAALGLADRVEAYFETAPAPAKDETTNAFWCACHGGQRASAEYLLSRGADLNWVGHDRLTPLDAASRSGAQELAQWLRALGGKSASD